MVFQYAFHSPRHFSSGTFSLKAYKQNLGTAIIYITGEKSETATPISDVFRRFSNMLSSLLKVVETWFWAQNDRNRQVYISTYNIVKL